MNKNDRTGYMLQSKPIYWCDMRPTKDVILFNELNKYVTIYSVIYLELFW